MIFIREYAGLGPSGTNRKAGSGWGRFRVQKQVVEVPMKMELTVGSETSAYINQTPGNYPKGNLL